MASQVRRLTLEDIGAADSVLQAAYGFSESRRNTLEEMLALEPEGMFVAEDAGEFAGLVTNVDYGTLGYVGMLGVSPAAQGKGVGRALMDHCLKWFSERGVPTVLLDATAPGKPLYEKLGFEAQGEAQLWQYGGGSSKPNTALGVRLLKSEDIPLLSQWDAPIFGGERGEVLGHLARAHPKRSFVTSDEKGELTGFLIARERMLGPWCAASVEVAGRLLNAALALPFESPPIAIIPSENQVGTALLTERGFKLKRSCDHMRLGPSVLQQRHKVYGQTSFALG